MAGDVCVLIPTLDESATIGEVVAGFAERGYDDVLVVDGGSTDGTPAIARREGARVVQQSGSGKGQAVREGVELTDADVVLMLDGDGTYDPGDAERMLEPLLEGRADHVIGDRFADMKPGAMARLNKFGNRVINGAFRYVHGRDLADILSGYRAFRRESLERFSLSADGFTIETELSVECVRHGQTVEVVPITYRPRPDDSEANLRPFRDGGRIIVALYRLARMNNPLFYFGSVGLLSGLVGAVIGAYVGIEWITVGISHPALAVVGSFGILLGVQLFMFGVLSDMLLTVNRRQARQLERVADGLHRLRRVDGATAPRDDGEQDPAPDVDGVSGDADPGRPQGRDAD
jgi:dolichol-phosphate mannosyltransferase